MQVGEGVGEISSTGGHTVNLYKTSVFVLCNKITLDLFNNFMTGIVVTYMSQCTLYSVQYTYL